MEFPLVQLVQLNQDWKELINYTRDQKCYSKCSNTRDITSLLQQTILHKNTTSPSPSLPPSSSAIIPRPPKPPTPSAISTSTTVSNNSTISTNSTPTPAGTTKTSFNPLPTQILTANTHAPLLDAPVMSLTNPCTTQRPPVKIQRPPVIPATTSQLVGYPLSHIPLYSTKNTQPLLSSPHVTGMDHDEVCHWPDSQSIAEPRTNFNDEDIDYSRNFPEQGVGQTSVGYGGPRRRQARASSDEVLMVRDPNVARAFRDMRLH